MKNLKLISILGIGLSLAQAGLAQETPDANATTELKAGGIGAAYGNYSGNKQASFLLQTNGVSISNDRKAGGDPTGATYAAGGVGLEFSPDGMALSGQEHSGVNLWRRQNNQSIIPLVGLEPLNMAGGTSVSFHPSYETKTGLLGQPYTVQNNDLHRMDGREPFFEWTPMASAGVQVFSDTCKAMLMVRGGASIGTLGDGGARPAYGIGAMGACKNFLFNADLTRIAGRNQDIDMASFQAGVKIPGQSINIGALFDARQTKDVADASSLYSFPSAGPRAELAGKVVLGGTF